MQALGFWFRQKHKTRGTSVPRVDLCAACGFFANDPHEVERAISGLATMSSGHASVRADDGFCRRHDRYVRARYACADFAGRS